MNKLVKKISALSVGLAMAIGVGVAVGSSPKVVRATDASWTASAQGYTNSQAVSESTIDSNISITFTNGGSATAYYDTGTAVRIYNGGTFTISAASGTMSSIVLGYELNGTATISCSDSSNWNASTKTWSGDSNSVTWTAGTGKHVRLSSVTVTYSAGSVELDSAIEDQYHHEDSFTLLIGAENRTFMFYDASGASHVRIYDDIEWSIGNSSIVEIILNTSECTLRALQVGSTTLTASAPGYKSSTVEIIVEEDTSLPEMEIWDSSWKVGENTAYLWSSTVAYKFYVYLAGDSEREAADRTLLAADSWEGYFEGASISTGLYGEGVLLINTDLPQSGSFTITAYKAGYQSASVEISLSLGSVERIVISGSMSKTKYLTSDTAWNPNGLKVKAEYSTGCSVYVTNQVNWTYSPSVPTDGVTSVTCTAAYNDGLYNYIASTTVNVSVTVPHAGTAEDPFTVSEALAKCAEIGAVGNTGQGPWVTTGIITRVTSAPAATYWNATYYISDDGTQTDELQVYRGFYLDNAKFDAETALLLKVGKVVTVTGNLTGSYGNEYCQGNYLLEIKDQETGDVDVTFDPASTSFEIGATGTFTATSETAGVEYSWESDNESVLSVNSETGFFEALSCGVAKVTVTASAGGKEGSTYALITVNGKDTMNVVDAITFINNHGTADHSPYYIYVEGYVSSFDFDGKSRGFKIMPENFCVELIVYTGTSSYSEFISDLSIGSYIKVKATIQNYSGTLELTDPVKLETHYSHANFANDLLTQTDAICTGWKEGDNNHDAIESLWTTLSGESYYGQVSSTEIAYLADIEANEDGNLLQQAMARYDYLTKRYNLDNFIEGRVLEVSGNYEAPASSENSNAIVIVIALTSVLAFSTLLLIKRKKNVRK